MFAGILDLENGGITLLRNDGMLVRDCTATFDAQQDIALSKERICNTAVLVVAGFSVTACRSSDDSQVVFTLRFEPLPSRTGSRTDAWQNRIQQCITLR
jgi:hypothetical protein